MSMTIATIQNLSKFNAWKAEQSDYVPNRWANETDQNKGFSQIRALRNPTSYPFVIVYQWIGTTQGPFLDVAVVTMNHFPEENNRLPYLENLIIETRRKLKELAETL
jgi:hypothetical protein